MAAPHGVAWQELTGIMARLADGDEAAVIALYVRFGGRVRGTVRAVLRSRSVALAPDDVDGLVLDACTAIAAVAAAWSPEGGALPWIWARRRIENCVDRLVGQRTVPLDDHVSALGEREAAAPAVPAGLHDDGVLSEAFDGLAAGDPRCRLLADAFDRVALTPLDREMCLQYAVEQGGGNRAPAVTVGTSHGLRAAAVRQRVRRTKGRLRHLAANDPRYAPIAQLPLLA